MHVFKCLLGPPPELGIGLFDLRNSLVSLLGISTSGNSPNILQALEAAQLKGITTFGLTGQNGGKMRDLCDYCLCVPSVDTPRIQEAHILIGHTICAMVELSLFEDPRPGN